MTKKELTARYVELMGRRPAKGTPVSDIAKMVSDLELRQAQQAERQGAEQAERDRVKAHCAANIARRGTAEEFAEHAYTREASDEDRAYARRVRKALHAIESHAGAIAKFSADLLVDPAHALVWSGKVFESTANAKVAAEVIAHFEHGGDEAMWVEYATGRLIGMASYLEQSTSPTSNLMADNIRAAWARQLRD